MDDLIVEISDLHSGLRMSLLNPKTRVLDANGQAWTPELTVTQEYLWDLYLSHVAQACELAKERRLILLLLGDLTQGLRHWSGVWGTTLYDHIVGALAVLEPLLELEPAVIRFVQGTESHNDGGTADLLMMRELARQLPHCDVDIAQHYKTRVSGMPVDYAHHGPSAGIRAWTTGNAASHYLKSIILEEIVNGDEPPRVVLRAHIHQALRRTEYLESKRGAVLADIVVSPGYCGINPYARKACKSPLTQTHGMVAVEVNGGEPVIHQLDQVLDTRKEESL